MAELQVRMTQREFIAWREFYRLYPFDDTHRVHRPAALLASRHGMDAQAALDWLQPDPRSDGLGDADMNTLRAFGFTTKAN